MPEPSPPTRASRLVAQARQRAGISSAARTRTTSRPPLTGPGPRSGPPRTTARAGAAATAPMTRQAPSSVDPQQPPPPRRSAAVVATSVATMPRRAAASSTPWAAGPAPNSPAAKVERLAEQRAQVGADQGQRGQERRARRPERGSRRDRRRPPGLPAGGAGAAQRPGHRQRDRNSQLHSGPARRNVDALLHRPASARGGESSAAGRPVGVASARSARSRGRRRRRRRSAPSAVQPPPTVSWGRIVGVVGDEVVAGLGDEVVAGRLQGGQASLVERLAALRDGPSEESCGARLPGWPDPSRAY